MDHRARLLALAEAFRAARKLSLARVSTLVRNDGKFFDGLEVGNKSCTMATYEAVLQWFSDNWPVNAVWPDGVERPAPGSASGEAA